MGKDVVGLGLLLNCNKQFGDRHLNKNLKNYFYKQKLDSLKHEKKPEIYYNSVVQSHDMTLSFQIFKLMEMNLLDSFFSP